MGFSHRTTLKLIGNQIKTMANAKSSRGMIAVDKMGAKVYFSILSPMRRRWCCKIFLIGQDFFL